MLSNFSYYTVGMRVIRVALFAFIIFVSVPLQSGNQVYASDESRSVFHLGERFFNDSLHNLAIEQYKKYLNTKDRNHDFDPIAYYRIAQCYFSMDKFREASEAFEEYIRMFPDEDNIMDAMLMAGDSRKANNNFKEASDWYYSVWSRYVGSSKAKYALYQAGLCSQKDNNQERALELYNLYFTRFPKDSKSKAVVLSIVNLYIGINNYSLALDLINTVSDSWKNDKIFRARVIYYKAFLLYKMQKIESSLDLYSKLDSLYNVKYPEKERSYKDRIAIYTDKNACLKAFNVYGDLNNYYKNEKKVLNNKFIISWADCARMAKKYDKSVELYGRLSGRYKDLNEKSLILYRTAECHVGMGNFAKAIEILQEVESIGANNEYSSRSVLKIGDLYFSKGLYPGAISAYRRYLSLKNQKNKDKVIYRIGKIYQNKFHRYGASIREYENLLKQYPSSLYASRAIVGIAECYEATDELKSAIRQYEFIIESGTDSEIVKNAVDKVNYLRMFRIKDLESATYRLSELLEINPDSLTELERLQKTADIFLKYLKDFPKALNIYRKLLDNTSMLSDSVRSVIIYKQALIYQRLYEKAIFEDDSSTAGYMRKKALVYYKKVLDSYPNSLSADDAAYGIIRIAKPNISEYEKFVENFPQSEYTPEIIMDIAQYYEKQIVQGNKKIINKVINLYNKIIRDYSNSKYASKAYISLAENYLSANLLDSVKVTLDLFDSKYSKNKELPEVWFLRGIIAKREKDYSTSANMFKQVLYRYPFSHFASRARFELGYSELENGNIFEALNDFKLFVQNYPKNPKLQEVRYGIAKCLYMTGKNQKAKKIFEDLLNKDISDYLMAEIHYNLAILSNEANDSYNAIMHYKKAIEFKDFRYTGTVLKKLGDLYFKNRIYSDASDCYVKSLPYMTAKKDSIRIMIKAISAGVMNGEISKTEKRIKSFKKLFTDENLSLSEVVFYQGLYRYSKKEYDKAINRFKYVIDKYSESEWVDDAAWYITLSTLYAGQEEKAFALLKNFSVSYPRSKYVGLSYFKIGMILHGRGKFVEAADFFKRVIKDTKTEDNIRFRAMYNAAVDYQKISSWDDAATLYKQVLKEYSQKVDESSMCLKIGFCLIQGSRIESALEYFKKANIHPSNNDKPEILYWIATCYSRLGKYREAITEYLKIPYLFSGVGKWGITAEFESARLYERLNEYPKAINLFKKIVRSDGENGRFGRQAIERIQRLNTIMTDNL